MNRVFDYEILDLIQERWSPRAFSTDPIEKEDVMAVLEAARYAPSCFNEQPWRFIVAQEPEELSRMQGILTEDNREWAKYAPVLILILSKKTFELNGKENYWHMFDAGTSWGFLSLEAQRRGLITHAMGGFSRKRATEEYKIPEEYTVIAAVAMGRMGSQEHLSPRNREREKPGLRVPLNEVIFPGK
jgi:nitroreductase